jgi:hypothetical protein
MSVIQLVRMRDNVKPGLHNTLLAILEEYEIKLLARGIAS